MACVCKIPTTICPNFRSCGIAQYILEPEPAPPKFCRDCLHCDKPDAADWRQQRCHRPRSEVYNLVTGEKIDHHYECHYERHWAGDPKHPEEGPRCGKEGQYWEPRPIEPAKPARSRRKEATSGQPNS